MPRKMMSQQKPDLYAEPEAEILSALTLAAGSAHLMAIHE
jgi:hypothetical protein